MKTLKQADKLIDSAQYSRGLSLLESVNVSALDEIERGIWLVLHAECELFLRRDPSVSVDEAIEIFRFTAETRWFARAKFVKGWHLQLQGQLREGKEELIEAYANFLRCKDLDGAAKSLCNISFSVVHLGDYEAAIENLDRSVAIYEQIGKIQKAAVVAHNKAYVQILQGSHHDALETYKDHFAQARQHGKKYELNAYNMSALPYAYLGDIKTARKTIAKAKPLLDSYIRDKAIYYENLGAIEILDGNYDAAEKALAKGLEISMEIAPESALISQIKRLFGDLYTATGQWDKAEKFTREAMTVAEKIRERIEIAACHRVLARIAQLKGDSSGACKRYEQAVDLFNLIGARYELACTRYEAASSGLYVNGERRAMLYLARGYFEQECIEGYLGKVDRALAADPPTVASKKRRSSAPVIIAGGGRMKKILEMAANIAESSLTVLLTGETGTGKDLLAKYIHHVSGRTGEFVSINTAAIPDDMAETELFGHVKGAFTGASGERKGLIEQADGGTLYLNEIADASPRFQAKLLEVIESREVRRLGENRKRKVNFRLISATNHDIQQRIDEGAFRHDLLHRLSTVKFELPVLRERRSDIPDMVRHFLALEGGKFEGNGDDLLNRLGEVLKSRSWPGNVRELQAVVGWLYHSSGGDVKQMIELAGTEIEDDRLLTALRDSGGNQSAAARRLGLSEGAIRYRLRRRGD